MDGVAGRLMVDRDDSDELDRLHRGVGARAVIARDRGSAVDATALRLGDACLARAPGHHLAGLAGRVGWRRYAILGDGSGQ